VQPGALVAAVVSGYRTVEFRGAGAPAGKAPFVVAGVRAGAAAGGALVLVGHEPALSAIGDLLIQGELAPLDKAQAVRIDGGVERARLAWNAAG
jgi:hypothetical protein